MELIRFYYYNLGEEPSIEEQTITENTFSFLKDNGLTDEDIIKMIGQFPTKMALTQEDLPESLWEGSLVKRNVFYYHNELHISSPAPYWDLESNKIISHRFFLEMKINYGIKEITRYFYRRFPLDISLVDEKKDKGSIEYLLNKYKNLGFIESLDFLLYLIDEAVNQEAELTEIIELKRFEKSTYEYLKTKTLNAAVERMNKIIWR